MPNQYGAMEPGARDRLVTIQARSTTDALDAAGAPTELAEFEDLIEAWMSKEDVSGRERFTAQQMTAPYDTRWQMGYRADMDPDLVDVPKLRRLVYKDRTFDIVQACQIGRLEGVELLTLAGGPADVPDET